MKQKIKIPEAIVKRAATALVNELKSDWSSITLKKADIPSTKQLISKVITEINNCPYVQERLLGIDGIEDMIYQSFHSDILNDYYDKLSDIESTKIIALEQQLVQQVKDMGYEVKKKTRRAKGVK